MNNERDQLLNDLVATAPRFLGRNTPPDFFRLFGNQHLNSLDSGADTNQITNSINQKLLKIVLGQKIVSAHLPAAFLLRKAFDAPKGFFDDQGVWYTDIVPAFVDYLTAIRFKTSHFKPGSPAWSFKFMASFFEKKLFEFIEWNQVWEMGYLFFPSSKKNQIPTIITISLPWERSYHPWYKQLSSDRGFVGRGFDRNPNGPVSFNQTAQIFNSSIETTWWGQAFQVNQINPWGKSNSHNDLKTKKPRYAQTVIHELDTILHRHTNSNYIVSSISQAEEIYGFIVRAYYNPDEPSDTFIPYIYPQNLLS